MSRNMLIAWFPHSIYMVYGWTMEIKEKGLGYDVRAHVYGMLALR